MSSPVAGRRTASSRPTCFPAWARARYQAVTVTLKQAFTDRHQFLAHYTWSRDKGNADPERDAGTNLGPSNAFDIENDFGINERNITHRFVFQGTAHVGAGITLSGIGTFRSGLALAATGADIDGNATAWDRPVDADGNIVPRFPENQPNFINVDVRVMWTGNLGKAGDLDLLFEVFNLFNNSNYLTTTQAFASPVWGLCGGDPNTTNCDTFLGVSREAQIGIKSRFGSGGN